MGKIVKFCDACSESFAEKFEYCPNCGEKMEAFEMNPIEKEKIQKSKSDQKIKPVIFEDKVPETVAASSEDIYETVVEEVPVPETKEFFEEPILELDSIDEPKIIEEESNTIEVAAETFIPRKSNGSEVEEKETNTIEVAPETFIPRKAKETEENGDYYSPYSQEESYKEVSSVQFAEGKEDEEFHVHFLKEKNVKQRNLLLLGSMIFMLTLSVGAVIYSIFDYNLNIGSIDEDLVAIVPIIDETPMSLKEELEMKKDKGGGGGGGGRDEDTPTSKGQFAQQTREPILKSPSKTDVKKNFELQQQSFTEGDKQNKQTDEPYGNPNSKYDKLSDGGGSGGGQGEGSGTGQGDGEGTGRGTGRGSGSGDGIGRGNGDGEGDGGPTARATPRPTPRSGPTTKMQLLSKPQPRYTEEARKNNYQGKVILRVTFLANGRVGSVSAVNRLPYGLTEQAIAAAKRIQFKPGLRNGQPISETRRIQYSFTIY